MNKYAVDGLARNMLCKIFGLPKSINKAIRIAKGRYIVRVDSDDYVSRNFLYMCSLTLGNMFSFLSQYKYT